MIFKPHSEKQDAAIFSPKRIILCSTGIQWGKTTVGAALMKMWVHQNPGPDCNFIVTAPDYKILKQASLPELLKVMDGCGEYKAADATFELYSGARIFCRTATHPDSIVGITNVYGIWGDEAGKYPYYFWVNIQGRAAFKKAPIVLTTSLYSFNWVCKELIVETEKGLRDDVHICQAESLENPYFPREEYEAQKKRLSPARFAMMYGGRPAKREGLVYDEWDFDGNVIKPYTLPPSTSVYAGIDWGFTQPFACIVVAKIGQRFVIVSEIFQTRMTIDDIIDRLKPLQKIWDIRRFYAGPDQPASIELLTRAGLPCSPADNNVKAGIDVTYQLIKEKRLQMFEGQAPNLEDELESYHWPDPKDLKPDQDDKDPNPVKQDDHAVDALRYVMMSIGRRRKDTLTPKVPEQKKGAETVEQRLKRLKKARRVGGQEKWS